MFAMDATLCFCANPAVYVIARAAVSAIATAHANTVLMFMNCLLFPANFLRAPRAPFLFDAI
jgi:hypothetical protein